MKSYKEVKEKLLKDKQTKCAYDDLGEEFDLAKMVIEKRLAKGMTQSALAKKLGTKQSAVARLESGSCNPTVYFLRKIAKALDSTVSISIH